MTDNVSRLRPKQVSPASLAASVLDNIDDVDLLIVISVTKDGTVQAGWSKCTSSALAFGLMAGHEIVKQDGVFNADND